MPFVLLELFSLQDCKKGKGISQADLFLAPRTFPWTGTPQLCPTRTLSEVWLSRRSCAAGRTPCLHSPALRLHQETPGLTVRASKSSLAPALSFLSPAREKNQAPVPQFSLHQQEKLPCQGHLKPASFLRGASDPRGDGI